MLFRRVRDHVRGHDWFAVSVDLIVVVVGIYLGFQVTAWDEHRRLLMQREDYLSRLVDDLQDDVEEADIVDRVNRIAARNIDRIEPLLANGVSSGSGLRMEDFFFTIANTRRIILRRNTFDEMQSSGQFGALIDGQDLRDDLVEYYSDRIVRDQFNVIPDAAESRFRERAAGVLTSDQQLASWPEDFRRQVEFEFPEASSTDRDVEAVIEAMLARPDLLDVLPDLKTAKVLRMREASIVRARARALIGRIEPLIEEL